MAIDLPPIAALRGGSIVPDAPRGRGQVLAAGAPSAGARTSIGEGAAQFGQGMADVGRAIQGSRQAENRRKFVEGMMGTDMETRNAAMQATGGGPNREAAAMLEAAPAARLTQLGVPENTQAFLRGLYDQGMYDEVFAALAPFAQPGTAGKDLSASDLVKVPDGKGGFKYVPANQAVGQTGYEEEKLPTSIQEWNVLRKNGMIPPEMTYLQLRERMKQPGTTINVGGGQNDKDYGKPDTGYVWGRDANGNIILRPTEEGIMRPVQVPIAGGKADNEARQIETADAAAQKQKAIQSSIVSEDIDRALNLITTSTIPVTGLGSLLAAVPGTPAHSLGQLLSTIKANVGFDKLQAMREASPSGGALGAVSERENTLLQSVLGALEQSNSADELAFNLRRVQEVLRNIVDGPPEVRIRSEVGAPRPAPTAVPDPTIDALIKKYGG